VEKKGGDFGHQLPCQTDRSLEQTCPEKWSAAAQIVFNLLLVYFHHYYYDPAQ
jgi:hypothetical protein